MLLAFRALAVLEHTSLSEEERSQIAQTIEMFEVITQTQPDDYQIARNSQGRVSEGEEAGGVAPDFAQAGGGLF